MYLPIRMSSVGFCLSPILFRSLLKLAPLSPAPSAVHSDPSHPSSVTKLLSFGAEDSPPCRWNLSWCQRFHPSFFFLFSHNFFQRPQLISSNWLVCFHAINFHHLHSTPPYEIVHTFSYIPIGRYRTHLSVHTNWYLAIGITRF